VIEPDGVFKYVLLTCAGRTYVRGADLEYHADIVEAFGPAIAAAGGGARVHCPGGGRMRVTAVDKRVLVYGYSKGFGRADHGVTAAALRRHLGADWAVDTSNEGY